MNSYYIKKFSKTYFLFLFLIFALASSVDIYGGKVREGLFPTIYYIKHLVVVLLGVIGLFYILKKKKISIVFLLIFVSTGYITINFGIIFLQYLFFLLACYMLSYMYSLQNIYNKKIIYLYFLIILLIPILNIIISSGDFIYNNYYGRYRLLLGFFHPKEVGILFLILFLQILLMTFFKRKVILHIVAITLLFLIQSRNALFFYINFLLFSFFREKFGVKFMMFIFMLYLIIPTFLIINYYEEINLLLSRRLDVWTNKINISLFGNIGSFSGNYLKFHADNFYIEFLVQNGIVYFILLLIFLIFIGYSLKDVFINGYSALAIYISFLIYCFFDSGMFSTGNLLDIFIWSLIIFSLRYKRMLINENYL